MTYLSQFNDMAKVLLVAAPAVAFANVAPQADPHNGDVDISNTISKNHYRTYTYVLTGDEVTAIILEGTDCVSEDDIDLKLYDMENNLLDESISADCFESIYFEPSKTDSFQIVVDNEGKYDVEYNLRMH